MTSTNIPGLSNDAYADRLLNAAPAAGLHQDAPGESDKPEVLADPVASMLGLLERIRLALVDGRPTGEEVKRVVSVTATPQEVTLDVVSYTMFNDGPNEVYTGQQGPQVDTVSGLNPPLNPGDSDAVNFGRRTEVRFWIVCASGETASVRIRGVG